MLNEITLSSTDDGARVMDFIIMCKALQIEIMLEYCSTNYKSPILLFLNLFLIWIAQHRSHGAIKRWRKSLCKTWICEYIHITPKSSTVYYKHFYLPSSDWGSITASIWSHLLLSVCELQRWTEGAGKEYLVTGRRICDPAAAVQQPSPSGEHTSNGGDTCVKGRRNYTDQTKGLFYYCTSKTAH